MGKYGLAAGICLILGAIGYIVGGVRGIVVYEMIGALATLPLGILSLLGAFFAFKRERFVLILTISIITLNILALIFLILGKNEF